MKEQYTTQYHIPNGTILSSPYTKRDEDRVKVVANRLVGELSDGQYKNMMSSYGAVRAAFSLKNFLFNQAQLWYKGRHKEGILGIRKVVGEGKDMKVVYDEPLVEGIFQTLWHCAKELKNGNFAALGKDLKEDEFRRRNLIVLATFGSMIGGLLWCLSMAMGDAEDDKTPWQKMTRYIIGGALEEQMTNYRPDRLYTDFWTKPFAYKLQAENTVSWAYHSMFLPFTLGDADKKGNVDIQADIDAYLQETSRVIPYGGLYRNIRSAMDSILESLSTTNP
jgi:hypothetical protein